MNKTVIDVFNELHYNYPSLASCKDDINKLYSLLVKSYQKGGKLLVCGNGGSAADSEHIVGELMKGFNLPRKLSHEERARFLSVEGGNQIADSLQNTLEAISLVSQSALMTAFLNDVDPSMLFAQQVYGYINPADVFLGLSTSGNSANVINAAKTAKCMGAVAVAITGKKESGLSDICDVTVRLPAVSPYEVQEFTLPLYHAICAALELEFFSL